MWTCPDHAWIPQCRLPPIWKSFQTHCTTIIWDGGPKGRLSQKRTYPSPVSSTYQVRFPLSSTLYFNVSIVPYQSFLLCREEMEMGKTLSTLKSYDKTGYSSIHTIKCYAWINFLPLRQGYDFNYCQDYIEITEIHIYNIINFILYIWH